MSVYIEGSGGPVGQVDYIPRPEEPVDPSKLRNDQRRTVVVLGAGPGGIAHAIDALFRGHSVHIVEKRDESYLARKQAVALQPGTVYLLKAAGIYQSLLQRGMIFADTAKKPYLAVRIGDLEQEMRSFATSHSMNLPRFTYNATLTSIDGSSDRATLHLSNGTAIENVDLVINAEGAKSSTNELLNLERKEDLPKMLAISAIFTDTRPRITGLYSLAEYAGKTLVALCKTIYYYALFFFRFVFCKERYTSEGRKIIGALTLNTPGQTYLGLGLRKKEADELSQLEQKIREGKESGRDVSKLEARYEEMLKSAARLGFCVAGFYAVLSCFTDKLPTYDYDGQFLMPSMEKVSGVWIGTDHLEHDGRLCTSLKLAKKTYAIIVGDALATVDPTTGSGCNRALESANKMGYIYAALAGLARGEDSDVSETLYQETIEHEVEFNRLNAEQIREFTSVA